MIRWPAVVERGAALVDGYTTPVTLRQLHYLLVSEGAIPNTTSAYKRLSEHTAAARRDGRFPDLLDRVRSIHGGGGNTSPGAVLRSAAQWYHRDRTEGQAWSVYVGAEKATLIPQLTSWVGDRSIPVLALGGYSSQSYVDDVRRDVSRRERPAVLLYVGDHDPSGEDIDRDFVARTGCWEKVIRVAVTAEQVAELGLPRAPGKTGDSRAAGFVARHGELVQVEVEAMPPDRLRDLVQVQVAAFWDRVAELDTLRREADERHRAIEFAAQWRDDEDEADEDEDDGGDA